MSRKTIGFNPDEIIFSCTTACNLKCEHCFVNRVPRKLDIEQAITFLRNCAQSGKITRVGFTGGEPFLYMDFLLALTKETVSLELLFDQIMTNGDWWKEESDLRQTLQTLYDAGYDGKIGLSWDEYHGQSTERMEIFIGVVKEIFGEGSVNIQTVEQPLSLSGLTRQSNNKNTLINNTDSRVKPENDNVPVYTLPRTYSSDDPRAWQSRRWFREDYCQGPGNILYVHADGNIAPCCGFANENPALFIGRITDSYETIMNNAVSNVMVQRCFSEGLSHYRRHGLKKQLRACGKKLPGKTTDICSFCDFVCKLK
ncbi:MAG: radical SAM protein [Treponema sp.]|nr:radical SAM protein [Treponema sp.]